MQFPESWLREFCDPLIDSAALAELLTMAGLEVDEARPAAPPFDRVVVAEVLSIERHPNADRLSVCQVDAGTGSILQIVCGAPNVRAGIKVACALVGAELPPTDDAGKRLQIELGVLRGIESQGMLCSARELKLSDDHGGLLILDSAATVGQNIREHLKLDDTLLTLKLTPNLAHCLSVYGVAREISALTGAPLRPTEFAPALVSTDHRLPVTVEAPDLCGRFSGRVIHNVDTRAPTPAWMVERLARCGQRSVTALVDISNYVMFEYGQPSHIFDLDTIRGGLTVRWGKVGESLKLLNGNVVQVDADVGVIVDREAVESLAGIMGGAATAVSDATRHIYVEAAFWWPRAIAGRSRRYGLATDAAHRFERGVDPASTVDHLERITRLIVEICGGADTACGPVDDQILVLPEHAAIELRIDRASKVLGMPLTQAACEGVMRRLGLPFTSAPGCLAVTPPSWRFDLRIEEDLIEEIIRVLGYGILPNTPPVAAVVPRVPVEALRSADVLRRAVAALDYQETINFGFVDERWERELAGNPDPVRLVNPMASQASVMRSSLIGSLIGVLRHNLARKATRVRVFEIGRVFLRDAGTTDGPASVAGVHQPMRLAALAHGGAAAAQWGVKDRSVDFYDIKGDIEALFAPRVVSFVAAGHAALHPGRSAALEVGDRRIGWVGELHPKWRQAYELPAAPVLFEIELETLLQLPMPVHAAVQRHQSAWRDLSVVLDDSVGHDALLRVIREAQSGLVRKASLFDLYKPASGSAADIRPGERSLSVRLELLDNDATLTDERIDAEVASVLGALQRHLGARLRVQDATG